MKDINDLLINAKVFEIEKVAWYKDKLNWYVIVAWSCAIIVAILNLMKG